MELKNKKMLNKLTSAFLVVAMIFSLVIMPSVSVKAEAKTETKTEYDCPVMLMIDTSGSMQDQNKIVSTKEEAKKLFDTFKNIEVGLATFNSNGEKRIISSLTKDYEALKKQIDDLKVVGDKNKLERPLGQAIEMAKEHVASMKKYDKVVVKVMTDVTDKDGVPTSITKNATHHDDYTFMLNQPNQSIVLVIDASGSMDRFGYVNGKQLPTKKMENAKKAASGFIDAIKDKNIELGLVYFASNGVERTIPLTKDLDSIKRKINAINAGGGTPLGAAITQAGKELTDNAKTSQGRIIVFGDGESDDNAVEAATTLGKITENSKGGSLSIIVDTIGINVNENTRKQLAEIAAKGNGGYHDATDDLGEIAEGLGNNLDIIGVKITTPTTNIEPGKTLQLKVEGTKKKGDKVDITNSSNGTAYTVSDEKNVSVSKDGLVSIPANAKEDIEFTVRAKNNGT